MNYRFEQQVETLAQNAVGKMKAGAGFDALGLRFEQWDFNIRDGWLGNAWLVTGNIEAKTFLEAYQTFWSRLARTIPRITFVSQCYAEWMAHHLLVIRDDLNLAFLRYVESTGGVGLMFRDQSRDALNLLLETTSVPEEFFYYWNDAVNNVGYSAKLLLMFSALEALVKIRAGVKDHKKLENILGRELKEKLFGVKGASKSGLRHRLVHGEYFTEPDSATNYVEEVHKRVIGYFNSEIFKKELISLRVVNPQRHSAGNKREVQTYIRPKNGRPLKLKAVLTDITKSDPFRLENYESVFEEDLRRQFQN